MKHISLDHENDQIKTFVLSLPRDPEGSVLEIDGRPVLRILPPSEPSYDAALLKEAILRRRDESRAEMEAWADADSDVWNATE